MKVTRAIDSIFMKSSSSDPLDIIKAQAPNEPISFTDEDDYYGEHTPAGGFVFTKAWKDLDDQGKLYVALHELSHHQVGDGGSHSSKFYENLANLVSVHGVPFSRAREIEQVYPRDWEGR